MKKKYLIYLSQIVYDLKKQKLTEAGNNRKGYRPWVFYVSILEDIRWQVKIINVKPVSYSVKASYIGYVTTEDSVTITDTDINLDFNLSYTTIEGKEVTVTAQAKGQMDAFNRQLNARSIVNIISSDRIQELPDANAAESVARVPGVSIKREGGEGNKVVIRGLSPKYNAITVEGTRLPSTDKRDRSTDLSMICLLYTSPSPRD